jgi:hypothetical protein
MARKAIDLKGQKFNKLTVIERSSVKSNHANWDCLCECGGTITATGANIRNGRTQSCGCYRSEAHSKMMKLKTTTHGKTKTPEYKAWQQMKHRCLNHNNPLYHRYGGRGITVCDEWLHDFPSFLTHLGSRPEGMSLERTNNEKGYFPGNCKWATSKEQANNRCTNLGYPT